MYRGQYKIKTPINDSKGDLYSSLRYIQGPQHKSPGKVMLRQGEHIYIIPQDEIYYLKARGFYTEVVFRLENELVSVVVSKPISLLEREYNKDIFFRVHKSYLVNTAKVSTILRHGLVHVQMTNNELIPVARRRVNSFLSFLNNQA